MSGFDGDDYRKRVLAAVQARGGLAASDPFEWYDLPLTDVRDTVAVAQVEAVWAFWQKQRDSPKYRGLVTALLAEHAALAPLLSSAASRRQLAAQASQARAARTDDRGTALEEAAARLVARFGGVPRSKLAGVRAVGTAAGLSDAEVD
ncbi:MAG: hypothetical protein JWO60_1332, partial [Frankiales bacterium]|nr:hypothetical protein [Frankiales bacterium]